jgi:hypothetical protein
MLWGFEVTKYGVIGRWPARLFAASLRRQFFRSRARSGRGCGAIHRGFGEVAIGLIHILAAEVRKTKMDALA